MVPKYQEFYNVILNILDKNEEKTIQVIKEGCINEKSISPEDCAEVYSVSGVNVLYDRVNWAITYLRQAKLIEKSSVGKYKITERGIKYKNDVIDNKFLMQFDEFKEFINRSKKNNENDLNYPKYNNDYGDKPADERMNDAYNELNAQLIDDILDKLKTIKPASFEKLVNSLLFKMGYGEPKTTQFSHDGGIDGVIKGDKLGFDNIYVQAKRYNDGTKIGEPLVNSFAGAMDKYSNNRGVFITTSSFTPEAQNAIEQYKTKKIILIDGRKLAEYMIECGLGVEEQGKYIIKRIDEDFFENIDNVSFGV